MHEASEGWCGDGGHGKSVGNSLQMNEKCLKTIEKHVISLKWVENPLKMQENLWKCMKNGSKRLKMKDFH